MPGHFQPPLSPSPLGHYTVGHQEIMTARAGRETGRDICSERGTNRGARLQRICFSCVIMSDSMNQEAIAAGC